ncbi:MAG: spondin domain-containing protein [bacterium]|nr:spondin domain-containing protein [bacterium]
MLRISLFAFLTILLFAQIGCSQNKSIPDLTTFVVTIENISTFYTASGIFDTPEGDLSSGPADPGDSYEFTFTADAGSHLSLATMFVESNDLFYAPGANGIDLFPGGTAISGNVTSEFSLWDAGTEVNEEPGVGPNQPLRQDDPDTGTSEDKAIDLVDDAFTYPTVSNVINVSITRDLPTSPATFTVKIANVSDAGIFQTAIGPGVWVVHTGSNPIFTSGVKDIGNGLEDLAEDGDSTKLGIFFASTHGDPVFLGPGLWIAYSGPFQLFANGTADFGNGLEALAEDGDPTSLSTAVTTMEGVMGRGIFNLPEGASAPGVAGPGSSYKFTFEAEPGYKLTFATMFVQSNDLFYAPATDLGIDLFPGGSAFTGDITSLIDLWDCGTEVNEEPGVGLNQAPRQSAPNTGIAENGVVRPVSLPNDGFTYPQLSKSIRVTIESN